MRFAIRWLLAGAVVSACMLAWGWHAGRESVEAQGSTKPTVMKRIYTGTDGLSHVEDIVLDAKTVMEKVTSVEVRVSPPGRFSDWHPGPQRQYIINLAGSGQLEVAEGKVDLPPGSMEYHRRSHGQGSHDEGHEQGRARVDLAQVRGPEAAHRSAQPEEPTTSAKP